MSYLINVALTLSEITLIVYRSFNYNYRNGWYIQDFIEHNVYSVFYLS